MSTEIGQKIRAVRMQEGLTQKEFCELTGIKFETLKNVELGRSKAITSDNLLAITNHPRLKKYALYLVIDDDVEVDQEAPAPSADEFTEMLQSMSDEEVEQLVQYMEFLVAKREK